MILYFLNVWEFYNSNICMSNVWSCRVLPVYECAVWARWKVWQPGLVTSNADYAYASQCYFTELHWVQKKFIFNSIQKLKRKKISWFYVVWKCESLSLDALCLCVNIFIYICIFANPCRLLCVWDSENRRAPRTMTCFDKVYLILVRVPQYLTCFTQHYQEL